MREWIVTNGLGGYASLNSQNQNTRKFHGLLISSLNPPTKRWVFVSNIFDKIKTNDKTYYLSNIKSKYNFDYFPSFNYNLDNVIVKKTVFMEYNKNTTILKYEVNSEKPVTLVHTPVLNSRHFYDVTSQRYLSFEQDVSKDMVTIKPSNIDKKLKIILKDSIYNPGFYWDVFYYEKDRERNEAWVDNNVHFGDFEKTVDKKDEYYIVLTLENKIKHDPSEIFLKETQRKKDLIGQADLSKEFDKLVLSTDNFVVKKDDNSKSIVAGYHWFADWGRDTLISLPGITLVTRRFDDAKQILKSFSRYCKNGLIPNAFMDRDSNPIYNTVDASLWYVDRVFQYLKYTDDKTFLEEIWGTLDLIVECYKNGTDFNIKMDNDFLISHGPGLTWMDVKIDDYYPTPRMGKAVEIQALWYNALKVMSNLSELVGKDDKYYDLSERVKNNFNEQFEQVYDVVDNRDLSFRPNQIFLASLDFSMINKGLQKHVVDGVREQLVTVFGLRSLSPFDSNYKGSYIGDYNKDVAYHNGTVWPWLMGPFIRAFVKVKDREQVWRSFAFDNFLKPMFDVFDGSWDGSIYEIFDGDPVYAPRGCVSQAWSVAEILRTWVEDINNKLPDFEDIYLF
jgi:predicted glycogen debranching enzyme